MTGVQRRKEAQRRVDTARGVLSGLFRTEVKPGLAPAVAHKRLLLAGWRSLSHAYRDASAYYRPDSPTQKAMVDAHRSINCIVAGLQLELSGMEKAMQLGSPLPAGGR